MVKECPEAFDKVAYTSKETAKLLGISASSLRRYVAMGAIPYDINVYNGRRKFYGKSIKTLWRRVMS